MCVLGGGGGGGEQWLEMHAWPSPFSLTPVPPGQHSDGTLRLLKNAEGAEVSTIQMPARP